MVKLIVVAQFADDIVCYLRVIINNEDEPELLGMNRTEGYGSGKIFMPILDSLTKPGRPNESMM